MNAAKWTGLTMVLVAVVGVAVWNLAAPGPMAGYAGHHGTVAAGPSGSPATGDAPMASRPNANNDGLFGQMWQWCQQMWGRMTGWMGGMTGGGMHGHMGGTGMMGRGTVDRGWNSDARAPQNDPTPSGPSASPTDTASVQIEDFTFAPETIRIQAGETVTWINRDRVRHNVVFNETGESGRMLNQGQRWSYAFDEPGTYSYYCGPHPFMTGTVVVE